MGQTYQKVLPKKKQSWIFHWSPWFKCPLCRPQVFVPHSSNFTFLFKFMFSSPLFPFLFLCFVHKSFDNFSLSFSSSSLSVSAFPYLSQMSFYLSFALFVHLSVSFERDHWPLHFYCVSPFKCRLPRSEPKFLLSLNSFRTKFSKKKKNRWCNKKKSETI